MNQFSIVKVVSVLALTFSISGCLNNSVSSSDSAMSADNNQQSVMSDGSTKPQEVVKTASGGPLGGYIEQFMDANDKTKLARALDGGLGKSTSWKNPVSGADFAVTPTRKVTMGEGICRAYNLTMTKSGVTDRVAGTACIGDDGLWHAAG